MQLKTEDNWDEIITLRTGEVQNKVLPGEIQDSWWLWKMVNRVGGEDGDGHCCNFPIALSRQKKKLMTLEQEK